MLIKKNSVVFWLHEYNNTTAAEADGLEDHKGFRCNFQYVNVSMQKRNCSLVVLSSEYLVKY